MWIRPSTGVSCVYPWCDKNLFVAIVWFHLCVRLQVERKIGVSSESRYKRMISPTNRNSFQSETLHRRRAKQFSVLSTCFPGSTLHTWNKHPQISLPALQNRHCAEICPWFCFERVGCFLKLQIGVRSLDLPPTVTLCVAWFSNIRLVLMVSALVWHYRKYCQGVPKQTCADFAIIQSITVNLKG